MLSIRLHLATPSLSVPKLQTRLAGTRQQQTVIHGSDQKVLEEDQ